MNLKPAEATANSPRCRPHTAAQSSSDASDTYEALDDLVEVSVESQASIEIVKSGGLAVLIDTLRRWNSVAMSTGRADETGSSVIEIIANLVTLSPHRGGWLGGWGGVTCRLRT